jgi:hypothetical protein
MGIGVVGWLRRTGVEDFVEDEVLWVVASRGQDPQAFPREQVCMPGGLWFTDYESFGILRALLSATTYY